MYVTKYIRETFLAEISNNSKGDNMTVQEFWDVCGLDSESLMSRFVGNIQLAALCTKKFADGTHFNELCAGVADKNYDVIEAEAHALKGVGANLGFETFRGLAQTLVDDVRAGSYENIDRDFEGVKNEYERLRTEINKID